MATPKSTVSSKKNIWTDSERVDNDDLTLEQGYNQNLYSSAINNHIGSGVILDQLTPIVYYESPDVAPDGYNAVSLLDGIALYATNQPSDTSFGNQLEVQLSDSKASGRRTVKACVIGLDVNSDLQYEVFTFHKNEKQIGEKHFTKIALILINDLSGPSNKSLNLGGKLTISEASPYLLSRSAKMAAQDVEPNLFFRDFYIGTSGNPTLNTFLRTSLPSYNVDNLNISTSYTQLRTILQNDVSTRIGQKFLASTDNIQKITMLLSAVGDNYPLANPTDFYWSGDIVISIYPLQSVVSCPTDLVPNLAIDYDPANVPVAELSFNYNTLLDQGIKLTDVPQPVDFVFSNTAVGSSSLLTGNYYIFTIKRSGFASQGIIQIPVATDQLSDSRVSIFNGSVWTDMSEEDMWFQVWTDAAKVSSGQAYENGAGIVIDKVIQDTATEITTDYVLKDLSFSDNDVYTALVQATTENLDQVQDERTGNPIYSRQKYVPSIILQSPTDITNSDVSNPFYIGTIADKNNKKIDSTSSTFTSYLNLFGMYKNALLIKIIDDPADPRYNLNILELVNKFVDGSLNRAKFILNTSLPDNFYRVASAELCTMIYGDVNGDGKIDEEDLLAAQNLLNYNLNIAPSTSTYDGYTNPFETQGSLTFQIKDPTTMFVEASGIDGILIPDPTYPDRAIFTSASSNFSLISSIGDKIISITSTTTENNGTFYITGLNSSTSISIKKTLLTEENILKVFAADITGDLSINTTDINYISDYVYKVAPFPKTTSPGNRIGTSFNVIKIYLEEFIDRNDDYYTTSRADTLHPVPILFNDDTTIADRDFLTSPITFSYTKRITWEEYDIVSNSNPRLVPVIFTEENIDTKFKCTPPAGSCELYPINIDFDSGRNDMFVPNNLIMNTGGNILTLDGYYHKIDFEVGTIILEIPAESFSTEKTINFFTGFVADYDGNGKTSLGFNAMKFSDCSFVQLDALAKEQVRFGVSLQAFAPQLDGTDSLDPDISGVIIDDKVGVYINSETGQLTLNFTNLYVDPVLRTLITKLQVQVFLKKSGFNNRTQEISSEKVKNIFGLA